MTYNNLTDWATSICDAIREKEGSSDLIPAQDIPERIRGIQSSGWSGVENTVIPTDVLQTSSFRMANSAGYDIANILQTEVTCSVSD